MTTPGGLEWLTARGLDPEAADRLGVRAGSAPGGGECIVLPFVRDGKVVRNKYRHLGGGDRRWEADKGGIRTAFNEDCLRRDDLLDQPLVITEGEWDCLSALQAGLERTISVPDGAGQPSDKPAEELAESRQYAWLDDIKGLLKDDRVKTIVLATDDDEPGRALRHDLSKLLGKARCKFLTYPKSAKDRGRERCKDLNEVLEDYGHKGVVETIGRATWVAAPGVYLMSELPPPPPQVVFTPRRHHLLAENLKIRLGDFSVWTGMPSSGKSTFLNDLLCGFTLDYKAKIAWASFEQETALDHRRALRSWHGQDYANALAPWAVDEADAWIDHSHVFIKPSEEDDASLDWLMDAAQTAVTRHECNIVVIDPWNEIEHARRPGESETEYTGWAIRTLRRFARANMVHVAVVAHPAKMQRGPDGKVPQPTLYDISGSANWFNKADLGVIVHRSGEDATHVRVQKSRYHEIIGKPGTVAFSYNGMDRKFYETERVA